MLRCRNQSANVAKIIAKKAAETLTPMTLELGGRNPAIVTKNANVKLAAKRLLWGKIMVSPRSYLESRNSSCTVLCRGHIAFMSPGHIHLANNTYYCNEISLITQS